MQNVRGLKALYPAPEKALRTGEVPEQDDYLVLLGVEPDLFHPNAAVSRSGALEVLGSSAWLHEYVAEFSERDPLVLSGLHRGPAAG